MKHLTDIKRTIEQLNPELAEKFHIQLIRLFSSVVLYDFSASSDVDILVDFDRPVRGEFIDLAYFIEHQLQRKVDLVFKNGINNKYYKAIGKEIVYV